VKRRKAAPKRAKRPEFKITQAMLIQARTKARKENAKALFSLPDFPKSAIPPDEKQAMAQDSSIAQVNTWAAANVLASAFEEGQSFLGYALLSELAVRSEYRRPAEIIATEMTRKWIELTSTGDDDEKDEKAQADKITKIEAAMETLQVRDRFKAASEQDSFFGRSHIYLDTGDTDDRDELRMPIGDGQSELSKRKVSEKKPLKALRNVEPVWTYPTKYNSFDPLKSDWYAPEFWFVNGKELHRSRLLTFISREVPDLLKPAYSFGGLALSQMMKPYVDNWLRTRQAVADLIHSFAIMGVKMDMTTLMQQGANAIFDRADLFNLARDNRNLMLLNKDTEEFFNVNVPLSTLDALQAQTQEHMAAVAGIPLVKLFGIQPMGLNASSEGEIRVFYDWCHAQQESFFRPNLKVVIEFIQLSLFGEVDPRIGFKFRPLWALDDKAEAEKQKTEAETDDILISAGVLDPSESRKRVANDPETPYQGLDVDDMPDPPEEEDDEGKTDDPEMKEAA
jgi:phage-related protein (TIGR01555 family)